MKCFLCINLLRLFFIKAADEYWNSAHMMVQADDVGDVLKTLYSLCVADQEYDHSGVRSAQKIDALHGTKGAGGVVGESTSLLSLMAKCDDFKDETTAMHGLMAVLGIWMEQTPKGHPELAGRGVEYCWGKSKYEFRKHNNFVSSKENFEKRVMAALASVTLKRSRAYLHKANDYKRAYRMLNEGSGVGTAVQYAEIEKMRALLKTHRCKFD